MTHCSYDALRHSAGRFRGRAARGWFGNPGSGLGRGHGRFGRGRKFAAADLQLLILALLAEKPRHGYEIIKALDERSDGYYSPSPGMVYPALTYLEEIGHATVESEGTKKRYSITADGRAHLEANRASVDAMLEELAWIGRRMDRLRRVLSDHEGEAVADLDTPATPGGHRHRVLFDLHAARLKLKAVLVRGFASPPEEQRRIARILERAADEILGRPRGKPA